MSLTITQGYLPGCIGRVAELHAAYYSAASGFGLSFEAKVARELADFCDDFQPGRDGIWLLLRQGSIEGSVFIDGKNAATAGAHLRWFITSDAVRGQGAGRRLMGEAMRFVDACGYRSTHLWTFAGLDAARHLYEANGFSLVAESQGDRWGRVVTEQRFERDLAGRGVVLRP